MELFDCNTALRPREGIQDLRVAEFLAKCHKVSMGNVNEGNNVMVVI